MSTRKKTQSQREESRKENKKMPKEKRQKRAQVERRKADQTRRLGRRPGPWTIKSESFRDMVSRLGEMLRVFTSPGGDQGRGSARRASRPPSSLLRRGEICWNRCLRAAWVLHAVSDSDAERFRRTLLLLALPTPLVRRSS